MTKEDRQRDLLMAQLQKKRAMKQQYLRQQEEPENPWAGLVMTNLMLLAVKERADIFGALRQLRQQPPQAETLFDTVLSWLRVLSETVGHSVYELFLDDAPKRRRILNKLLEDLADCDGWEKVRMDGQGGSFALPGFDYAYRMAEQPSATLVFEKTALAEHTFRYTLTLGDGCGNQGLLPSQGVLWQENQGPLQVFTDRVLTEFQGGWGVLREQFDQISRQLQAETETLRDLAALLDQVPTGMNTGPLLAKERKNLEALRLQGKTAYDQIPTGMEGRKQRAQNMLLLLGGAISTLERGTESGKLQEMLLEAVYLLENAAQPL